MGWHTNKPCSPWVLPDVDYLFLSSGVTTINNFCNQTVSAAESGGWGRQGITQGGWDEARWGQDVT